MKKILSFFVVVIAVLVLSGCRQGYTSDYEVRSIEDLKATQVEVKFRIPFGSAIQPSIVQLIDSFNVEYPNITITLDVIGGYDNMKKATIIDIGGGRAPTMSVGYPDHFAEYLITDSIIRLDKFIESSDPRIGYSQAELDDFLEGYLFENRMFDLDQSFFGLPFNKSNEALFYNKDFFDHFELDVPKTWQEVEAVSAQIYDIVAGLNDNQFSWMGNIKTNLANNRFMPLMYDSASNFTTVVVHQFGGTYTSSLYRPNGVADVQRGTLSFKDDPATTQAFTYFQDLANRRIVNVPEAWEGSYGSNFFVLSQIVMNVGSTAGSSYYSASISDWDVSTIPYYNEDNKYVIQQGTNFCIFSQASDLEKLAAWLFIKHCLTPENTAEFAMNTGYMPVRHSAYELDEYVEFLEDPLPTQIGFSKVHNAARAYSGDGWKIFVDPAWAGSAKVREEMSTAVVQILVNKENIAQAINAAVARIG